MSEPIRRLPNPSVNAEGKLVGKATLTPEAMKTRGALAVPSSKVIPVIVVPGIMGSNLRARTNHNGPQNAALRPGEPAWRPPNGTAAGLREASTWKTRNPKLRQQILDGDTLEVDDTGLIEPPDNFDMAFSDMRGRWWGEIHWSSYGNLLCQLQQNLNTTFEPAGLITRRRPNHFWGSLMEYDKKKWDANDMPSLSEAELDKFAKYHYPVYACGYNWTQSNELSGNRLKDRALAIIDFWIKRNFDCKQVILVTHSMGGLVARVCAKQISEKIVGIVHGVMPAVGAPLAYRRTACGTETTSPTAGGIKSTEMEKFADIAGVDAERTTPAMATACGPLELLPNHLYPHPWLIASVKKPNGTLEDVSPLFYDNVYDLYRDFSIWYRVINPTLADPANKYAKSIGGVEAAIRMAIDHAENLHTKVLNTYYHPNTYAYYGADRGQASFGVFRWITTDQGALEGTVRNILVTGQIKPGSPNSSGGGRSMVIPENFEGAGRTLYFFPSQQDADGDGTVPHQSGDAPRGNIKRIFRTTGYDHQGSYKNYNMLRLTFHLIARIAQEAK